MSSPMFDMTARLSLRYGQWHLQTGDRHQERKITAADALTLARAIGPDTVASVTAAIAHQAAYLQTVADEERKSLPARLRAVSIQFERAQEAAAEAHEEAERLLNHDDEEGEGPGTDVADDEVAF